MKNSSLLAISLLFSWLLSEVVLAFVFPDSIKVQPSGGWAIIPEASWVEYEASLGWVPQKKRQAYLEKNGVSVPLTTNSQGFRGKREYAPKKPDGVFRIAAVGDSFTFGFGVRDEEAFPSQMEALIPNWEVMNLGVPGYGVDQMAVMIEEKVFDLDPDLVLVSVFPEDFWRATRAFNDAGHGKPYFLLEANGELKRMHDPVPPEKNFSVVQFPDLIRKNSLERVLYHSRLYRLVKKAVNLIRKRFRWEDPDTTPEWILGRAILHRMVKEVHSRGREIVFVIVPPSRWITGTVEPVRESMVRFAKRENVPLLDLTAVFQKAVRDTSMDALYIPQDSHWTSQGNALASESIIHFIETNLPKRAR